MNIPNVPLDAVRTQPFVYPAGFLDADDSPLDLTNCTLKMEVRLYGGQPGDALVTLGEVGSDIEGIRITDAAGGLINVIIDQATLAAFPGGPTEGSEPNAADIFFYDLLVIRPLPVEPLAMAGTFALFPGVTVP